MKTGALKYFIDPNVSDKKFGRLLMCLGAAVQDVEFKRACPTLCAIYDAYVKATKSFCFMITFSNALWLHNDVRALRKDPNMLDGTYAGALSRGPSERGGCAHPYVPVSADDDNPRRSPTTSPTRHPHVPMVDEDESSGSGCSC